MRRVKILVIYENGAGGHRGAALAISEALRGLPEVDAPTLELDTLAPKLRKKMYTTFMDIRPHLAPLVRFGFRFGMRPNPLLDLYRWYGSRTQPFQLRRFLDVVAAESPDLIAATHFRPVVACNRWVERGQLRVPVHAVIPDFVAHGLYAGPRIGGYCVASELVKQDLISYGVSPGRVQVTGLPVSGAMASPDGRPREELKRALGMQPQLPLVLVMGGARGDQDYRSILRLFDQSGARLQLAVLCGWNTALVEEIKGLAARSRVPIHVLGFQSNMAEWYQAADLLLTKPGGMTSAEALVMGKAMLYTSAHPGKEEQQAERMARAGVALNERTPERAVAVALRLLEDPPARRRLELAAAAYQPADAAQLIARALAGAARQARTGSPGS